MYNVTRIGYTLLYYKDTIKSTCNFHIHMYNYMKTWETSVRRNPAHQLEQTNSYAMHVIPCQVIKLMEQHTYILCIYVYPYSGTYSGTPGMCTECLLFPTAVSPSSVTGSIRNSQPSPTTSSLNISTDLWPPVG